VVKRWFYFDRAPQQERILDKDNTPCVICGLAVDLDSQGCPRRFHEECCKQWRSPMVQESNPAAGDRSLKRQPSGTHYDAVKSAAYVALDQEAIRRVGTAYWGDLADYCYWSFDHLNLVCFGGRINHPLIQFCRTRPSGGCVGLSHIDLDRPVIDVFVDQWTRRELPNLDVLSSIAHEMLHFAEHSARRDAGVNHYRISHNNDIWIAGVEQASGLLGVDLARLKKPFSNWPHEGWDVSTQRKLNESLRKRRFPWGAG
jgi:hypothetical protein